MLDVLGIGPEVALAYEVAVGRAVWARTELVDEIARRTRLTLDEAGAAVDAMVARELVVVSEVDAAALRVVPPALALRPQVAAQRTELVAQQQRLEEAAVSLAGLQEQYTAAKETQAAQVMERVTGIDALRVRLQEMAVATRREMLSLLPAHVLTPDTIGPSRALDEETLGRGVAMRTVVVESAARNREVAVYLRWLTEQGAEIRTVAALPLRLVVSDRVVGILPIDAENPRDGALVVRAPGLITALVALFESVWRAAKPWDVPRAVPALEIDETDTEILRVLATGATDEAASRHLGVSVRTVRRLVSALMTQVGAGSRFELGLRLGERGWGADELPAPAENAPSPVEESTDLLA